MALIDYAPFFRLFLFLSPALFEICIYKNKKNACSVQSVVVFFLASAKVAENRFSPLLRDFRAHFVLHARNCCDVLMRFCEKKKSCRAGRTCVARDKAKSFFFFILAPTCRFRASVANRLIEACTSRIDDILHFFFLIFPCLFLYGLLRYYFNDTTQLFLI